MIFKTLSKTILTKLYATWQCVWNNEESKRLYQRWNKTEQSQKNLNIFLIFESRVGCNEIFSIQSSEWTGGRWIFQWYLKRSYRNNVRNRQNHCSHIEEKGVFKFEEESSKETSKKICIECSEQEKIERYH